MKLINFELSQPSFSIELIGLGYVWDLHNAGSFLGVTVDPTDNSAVMKWAITGHHATKYSGCNLVFRGLKMIIVSPRDEELPYSEDTVVSGMSKIIPQASGKLELRTRVKWHADDPFHLLVEFQSRRSIEINADTVELIGIPAS